MLVTPHQSLTDATKHSKKASLTALEANIDFASKCIPARFADLDRRDPIHEPFFIDWLTMKQSHPFDLPIINAGVICSIDVNGEIEWRTDRASKVLGSYDTSIQLRSDGNTVLFSGNVSRFGRTNNLFGFSFADCLRRINVVLARFGLPAFTSGQKFYRNVRHSDGSYSLKLAYTGASISRMDLTSNYETGSLSNSRAYLAFLSTQQGNARLKVGTRVDGETVDWGRGSRRLYMKVYIKSAELRKHNGPQDLIDYCEKVGLVRFEITAKATELSAMGCNYLGGFDMNKIVHLYNDRASVLTRAHLADDGLKDLPNHLRLTARDYLNGEPRELSRATFFRHRSGLLPYGIDISVPNNVALFKPRVRVIELKAATVPSWYQLDERLVA
jgi:hypothetical protein